MNEYHVKVIVRNNLLLTAIRNAGYQSQKEFAEACGICYTYLNNLLTFKASPLQVNGSFSKQANMIMEVLAAAPWELWTPTQLTLKTGQRAWEREMGEATFVRFLGNDQERIVLPSPEDECMHRQLSERLEAALLTLPERNAKILKMRIMQDLTYDEIGSELGVTKVRVQQLEATSLRKLRHPSRSEFIKDVV